ncbi:E3 ubiquitin-protein ligase Jade-2,Protein Jade-3,Bromodomain-containing protein 1,Bromodomain and PHD finger-containing protein 3,Protein AF-10,Protein Jade-1,PHD finger protein rhinoceros,Histone-lysine N-methyltransferase ATX1,Histone-lysine N-methyltransferase ATX2,Protein AF-17,Peregrin [Lepeophtheirus salmonis]|uniref:PHD finger protein rhinoceros n=1 Tax=Lepeophtheirus salmonis TaxID=72036 RepID=A0A7R8H736_LEPSM|nr:E3 ubiquitin-protein ligase Jade-2,Protein Jade-3,Bromodomain-containing protein 1,Bromodomain and PHD finger-containing protein 3,Protein AF-10,Protein Jade-1,PHD finger protein rhinoceros,Histone-lysine N-methyltransferase ATX1,Histone-lysine N-methyltransferase ATX2,Protein AF-17,Peregrin [Lepeophtheirus salmonis]CAF2900700.1 E3 ubiquitin-protein ligase Jade-2,Protein Jade-3,Bromodomain-containing protein 1,Bromodomain and PHD finger-containing protein 3,Protein AF-10,Protein Jade-1,PHD fing
MEDRTHIPHPSSSSYSSSSHQARGGGDRAYSPVAETLFRKDLISAMKLPDNEPLTPDDYWTVTDTWKQDWEKGVQVPFKPEELPVPRVSRLSNPPASANRFAFPKKLMCTSRSSTVYNSEVYQITPMVLRAEQVCSYDMDETDHRWLTALNGERSLAGLHTVSELEFESCMEHFERQCSDKIHSALKNNEHQEEQEDTILCDVCRSPDSEECNEMVFCDKCNICVHQACYGITNIPSGQWLCRTCVLGARPKCELCPNKGGAMKCTNSGRKWAHVSCALWIPEVSIGCVEKMEPITKISSIPTSRWNLTCVLCKERVGCCIQCSVKTCKTAYHVTCAFKSGLEMRAIIVDENAEDGVKLRSYCQKHSRNQKRKDSEDSDSSDFKSGLSKKGSNERGGDSRQQKLVRICEFYKNVDINSTRRANGNKYLLCPRTEENELLSNHDEESEREKLKSFVHIRQDLERRENCANSRKDNPYRDKFSTLFNSSSTPKHSRRGGSGAKDKVNNDQSVYECIFSENSSCEIDDILNPSPSRSPALQLDIKEEESDKILAQEKRTSYYTSDSNSGSEDRRPPSPIFRTKAAMKDFSVEEVTRSSERGSSGTAPGSNNSKEKLPSHKSHKTSNNKSKSRSNSSPKKERSRKSSSSASSSSESPIRSIKSSTEKVPSKKGSNSEKKDYYPMIVPERAAARKASAKLKVGTSDHSSKEKTVSNSFQTYEEFDFLSNSSIASNLVKDSSHSVVSTKKHKHKKSDSSDHEHLSSSSKKANDFGFVPQRKAAKKANAYLKDSDRPLSVSQEEALLTAAASPPPKKSPGRPRKKDTSLLAPLSSRLHSSSDEDSDLPSRSTTKTKSPKGRTAFVSIQNQRESQLDDFFRDVGLDSKDSKESVNVKTEPEPEPPEKKVTPRESSCSPPPRVPSPPSVEPPPPLDNSSSASSSSSDSSSDSEKEPPSPKTESTTKVKKEDSIDESSSDKNSIIAPSSPPPPLKPLSKDNNLISSPKKELPVQDRLNPISSKKTEIITEPEELKSKSPSPSDSLIGDNSSQDRPLIDFKSSITEDDANLLSTSSKRSENDLVSLETTRKSVSRSRSNSNNTNIKSVISTSESVVVSDAATSGSLSLPPPTIVEDKSKQKIQTDEGYVSAEIAQTESGNTASTQSLETVIEREPLSSSQDDGENNTSCEPPNKIMGLVVNENIALEEGKGEDPTPLNHSSEHGSKIFEGEDSLPVNEDYDQSLLQEQQQQESKLRSDSLDPNQVTPSPQSISSSIRVEESQSQQASVHSDKPESAPNSERLQNTPCHLPDTREEDALAAAVALGHHSERQREFSGPAAAVSTSDHHVVDSNDNSQAANVTPPSLESPPKRVVPPAPAHPSSHQQTQQQTQQMFQQQYQQHLQLQQQQQQYLHSKDMRHHHEQPWGLHEQDQINRQLLGMGAAQNDAFLSYIYDYQRKLGTMSAAAAAGYGSASAANTQQQQYAAHMQSMKNIYGGQKYPDNFDFFSPINYHQQYMQYASNPSAAPGSYQYSKKEFEALEHILSSRAGSQSSWLNQQNKMAMVMAQQYQQQQQQQHSILPQQQPPQQQQMSNSSSHAHSKHHSATTPTPTPPNTNLKNQNIPASMDPEILSKVQNIQPPSTTSSSSSSSTSPPTSQTRRISRESPKRLAQSPRGGSAPHLQQGSSDLSHTASSSSSSSQQSQLHIQLQQHLSKQQLVQESTNAAEVLQVPTATLPEKLPGYTGPSKDNLKQKKQVSQPQVPQQQQQSSSSHAAAPAAASNLEVSKSENKVEPSSSSKPSTGKDDGFSISKELLETVAAVSKLPAWKPNSERESESGANFVSERLRSRQASSDKTFEALVKRVESVKDIKSTPSQSESREQSDLERNDYFDNDKGGVDYDDDDDFDDFAPSSKTSTSLPLSCKTPRSQPSSSTINSSTPTLTTTTTTSSLSSPPPPLPATTPSSTPHTQKKIKLNASSKNNDIFGALLTNTSSSAPRTPKPVHSSASDTKRTTRNNKGRVVSAGINRGARFRSKPVTIDEKALEKVHRTVAGTDYDFEDEFDDDFGMDSSRDSDQLSLQSLREQSKKQQVVTTPIYMQKNNEASEDSQIKKESKNASKFYDDFGGDGDVDEQEDSKPLKQKLPPSRKKGGRRGRGGRAHPAPRPGRRGRSKKKEDYCEINSDEESASAPILPLIKKVVPISQPPLPKLKLGALMVTKKEAELPKAIPKLKIKLGPKPSPLPPPAIDKLKDTIKTQKEEPIPPLIPISIKLPTSLSPSRSLVEKREEPVKEHVSSHVSSPCIVIGKVIKEKHKDIIVEKRSVSGSVVGVEDDFESSKSEVKEDSFKSSSSSAAMSSVIHSEQQVEVSSQKKIIISPPPNQHSPTKKGSLIDSLAKKLLNKHPDAKTGLDSIFKPLDMTTRPESGGTSEQTSAPDEQKSELDLLREELDQQRLNAHKLSTPAVVIKPFEISSARTSTSSPPVSIHPLPEKISDSITIKPSEDSTHRLKHLKMKFRGIQPPVAAETVVPVSVPLPSIVNTSDSHNTSNIRRMRKKELLNRYYGQDIYPAPSNNGPTAATSSSSEVSGLSNSTSQVMPPPPPAVRNIIKMPKAVASVTSVPTRADYQPQLEANLERKRKRMSDQGGAFTGFPEKNKNSKYDDKSSKKKRGRGSSSKEDQEYKPKFEASKVISEEDKRENARKTRGKPPKKCLAESPPHPDPPENDLKAQHMIFAEQIRSSFDDNCDIDSTRSKETSATTTGVTVKQRRSKKRKKEEGSGASHGPNTKTPRIVIKFSKEVSSLSEGGEQEGSKAAAAGTAPSGGVSSIGTNGIDSYDFSSNDPSELRKFKQQTEKFPKIKIKI